MEDGGQADAITDASDWPSPEMREFESKLRCPICQDFFRTAVLLKTCSHNSLSVAGECPVCRQSSSTADLQVNRLVDELVENFGKVRNTILSGLLPATGTAEAVVEPLASIDTGQDSNGRPRSLRKSGRVQTPAPDGVPCPVCSCHFAESKIESHVELCLIRGPASAGVGASSSPGGREPGGKAAPRKLCKPVYSLLKDAELKRLLADLQLSTTGDRDQWIRRHSEFLLLYNAESDAANPRSMAQLRNELRSWERTWSKKPPLEAATHRALQDGTEEDFDLAAANYSTHMLLGRRWDELLYNREAEREAL